jgi:acyl-CoA synthetase (AMP-forming)/AMP-acid ligase II
MSDRAEPVFEEYRPAFESADEPFLFYYSLGADDSVCQATFTRGQFLSLSLKAAGVLNRLGLGKGSRVLHCFGANDCNDLAFRFAGAILGTIPVTVNWTDDPLERVIYKYRKSNAGVILFSPSFNTQLREGLQAELKNTLFFDTGQLAQQETVSLEDCREDLESGFTKIIIFTSGTTGEPKGVLLPYRSYDNNRKCFEQMLGITESDRFTVLIVNPLHHTNSTAMTDWALRRPKSHIHLVERYSTKYWKILNDVGRMGYDRVIAPTVSRHFDFLEELVKTGRLPIEVEEAKRSMAKVDFLIGSAPVGPTTIARLQKYAGRTPTVRFGSTETCLQVLGIPRTQSEEARLESFRRGWIHRVNGEPMPGYYIGRPHTPYTEVRIVKGIERGAEGYLEDLAPGLPGYLITRGSNVMTGYADNPSATCEVFDNDWYLGLKDICFTLENICDRRLDYYWMSRDSSLLIKGGSNYSCEQVEGQLAAFIVRQYTLPPESFSLSVLGLKIDSEHEDACCVTIELISEAARKMRPAIEESFIEKAGASVPKGAKPDYVRFAAIPRTFKGSVAVSELKKEYLSHLKTSSS